MNVACPECRSVFRVDPAKVPPSGTRARCAVCGGVMRVEAPAALSAAGRQPWTPAAPTPATSSAGAAAGARPSAGAAAMPAQPPRSPTPAAPAVPMPAGPAAPAAPAAAASMPPVAAPALPPAGAATSAPASSASPASPVAGAAAAAGPSGGARRPINPFLANDPHQKAKRLARALVSDIVAYHPEQREQALRDGTLKQVFRDEIKKSYEEYVEQMGQEFADGTAHFQQALNDILAGGRPVF